MALAQFMALRFAITTEGGDTVSFATECCPQRCTPQARACPDLTWQEVQDAVCRSKINTTSRLWLQREFVAAKCDTRPRDAATVARCSAPLLPAMLGDAPLPGLSAVLPACRHNRVPRVRAASCALADTVTADPSSHVCRMQRRMGR